VIAGNHRLESFDFAVPVPGPAFVGTDIRAEAAYPGRKIEDLDLAGPQPGPQEKNRRADARKSPPLCRALARIRR
jgi:hypothetical protein